MFYNVSVEGSICLNYLKFLIKQKNQGKIFPLCSVYFIYASLKNVNGGLMGRFMRYKK